MKNLLNILTVLTPLLLFTVVFGIYKEITYGTLETYINSKKSDCEVILPKNMKVVYNSDNQKYAIQIIDSYGKQFLWARRSGYIWESFDVNTDFNDSCIAKSFAVQYLKQQDEHKLKLDGYK